MRKKTMWGIVIGVVAFLIVSLIVWIEVGIHVEWGPFSFLAFDKREKAIIAQYDASERQNEIVFYGASNFRLWKEMDEDMKPFVVQNHGFGGSTDADLLERADRLLYPYHPAIIVFQTGSNDCAKLKGTDDEIYNQVIERKLKIFETFHEKLPDAQFIVISGILMPGRSQYDEIIKRVNQTLRGHAEKTDYLYFVDAEEMTLDENGNHITEMFISDGIHLTHESRIRWANEYIKPVLEQVLADHPELKYLKQ
jgi:lysophospholipase L1-like esterase